jgi:predicted O-methyltransferase YrrM
MEALKQYFSEFGEDQKPMAASIQSLEFCGNLIKENEISSVLDAGSGLSSVYFHSTYPTQTTTIDDQPVWANKTKSFLQSHLNTTISIQDISSIEPHSFDFIFYDYGNMETRIYFLKYVLERCNKILYLDDMHVTYYRQYVETKFRHQRITFLPQTVDEYGRFGAIITKQR